MENLAKRVHRKLIEPEHEEIALIEYSEFYNKTARSKDDTDYLANSVTRYQENLARDCKAPYISCFTDAMLLWSKGQKILETIKEQESTRSNILKKMKSTHSSKTAYQKEKYHLKVVIKKELEIIEDLIHVVLPNVKLEDAIPCTLDDMMSWLTEMKIAGKNPWVAIENKTHKFLYGVDRYDGDGLVDTGVRLELILNTQKEKSSQILWKLPLLIFSKL